MTNKEIIIRLDLIKDGIDCDSFTIENINRLIRDINKPQKLYDCLLCGKFTVNPSCVECNQFVTNTLK